MMPGRRWKAREDLFLKRHKDREAPWCAARLTRTVAAVRSRRHQLEITKERAALWTRAEDDFLRSHLHQTDRWVAARLEGRTCTGVKKRRARLGFAGVRSWTGHKDALLMGAEPTPPVQRRASERCTALQHVAGVLDKSDGAVYTRRHRLLKVHRLQA